MFQIPVAAVATAGAAGVVAAAAVAGTRAAAAPAAAAAAAGPAAPCDASPAPGQTDWHSLLQGGKAPCMKKQAHPRWGRGESPSVA